MSDRLCNRCMYEEAKREAKREGFELRTRIYPSHGHSWIVVERAKIGTQDWQPMNWTFMALSEKCAC